MRTRIALLLVLLIVFVTVSPLQSNVFLRDVEVNAALETDMPVVFVDPPEVVADVGETVTVSAKVFNLSGDFYPTREAWSEGEPLPPLALYDWRYNYSLGHLYGIDLRLKWDPTILDYVSHTVMVPVDDHLGGILNGPSVIIANDNLSATAGTYNLTVSSNAPAPAFNLPDDNATAFTMTFNVTKAGACDLSFTNVDLPVDLVGLGNPFGLQGEIPHWTRHGTFRTGELLTRIESIQAGALVAGSLYDPLIHGEPMTVSTAMKNDNETATDTFNLSIYDGTTLLNDWETEPLGPDSTKILNYTVAGPSLGLHSIAAEASILHDSEIIPDELSMNITVVDTPTLQISGPSFATVGETVSFNALGSVHNDAEGVITTYTWTLWAPGQTAPSDTKAGQSVSFNFPSQIQELGNWTVMLVVKDNYGITARNPEGGTATPTGELLRPATYPYRETVLLEVLEPFEISILTPENKTYQTDDVPLVFTVNLAASWMGYSLDGQENVTVNSNGTLNDLPHGPHTIRVFARDAAGITYGSETVHFSVKDATPPTLSVTSPQNKTYDTTEIPLTFSLNEPVLWMGYSLDGQTNVTMLTSNSLLSGLSPGTHRVKVFAEDLHGNTGSSETIRFTVRVQSFPVELLGVVVAAVAVAAAAFFLMGKRRSTSKAGD